MVQTGLPALWRSLSEALRLRLASRRRPWRTAASSAPSSPPTSGRLSRDPAMASEAAQRLHLLTLAVAAAVLAVVCAIVAAVGPADGHRSTYTWPPKTLTGATPSNGWFTALPLLNRVPSKLEVVVPCSVAPPLREERPAVVLATAHDPAGQGGLRIQLESGALTLDVGGTRVLKQDWPRACPSTLVIRDGTVLGAGRAIPLRLDTPDRMPVVTGLFTTLDLRSGEAPRVRLETRVFATSQTPVQIAATWIGFAAVAAALILVAGWANLRGAAPRVGGRLRAAWAGRDVTDAVVVGGLLCWWVLAPTFTDDGWVWAENRAFDDLGALGLYYDTWGITSPTGYWNTWIEHWLVGATSDLVVMRIRRCCSCLRHGRCVVSASARCCASRRSDRFAGRSRARSSSEQRLGHDASPGAARLPAPARQPRINDLVRPSSACGTTRGVGCGVGPRANRAPSRHPRRGANTTQGFPRSGVGWAVATSAPGSNSSSSPSHGSRSRCSSWSSTPTSRRGSRKRASDGRATFTRSRCGTSTSATSASTTPAARPPFESSASRCSYFVLRR